VNIFHASFFNVSFHIDCHLYRVDKRFNKDDLYALLKTMINIKFKYLYRDGANYKNQGEVIFSNPNNLVLNKIKKTIIDSLISMEFFVALEIRIPDRHFEKYKWNEETDHNWHEFHSVELTSSPPTDICKRTIEEFIEELKSRKFDRF
jgi:hypothetical protein